LKVAQDDLGIAPDKGASGLEVDVEPHFHLCEQGILLCAIRFSASATWM
jgi:hypothetical protein